MAERVYEFESLGVARRHTESSTRRLGACRRVAQVIGEHGGQTEKERRLLSLVGGSVDQDDEEVGERVPLPARLEQGRESRGGVEIVRSNLADPLVETARRIGIPRLFGELGAAPEGGDRLFVVGLSRFACDPQLLERDHGVFRITSQACALLERDAQEIPVFDPGGGALHDVELGDTEPRVLEQGHGVRRRALRFVVLGRERGELGTQTKRVGSSGSCELALEQLYQVGERTELSIELEQRRMGVAVVWLELEDLSIRFGSLVELTKLVA